MANSQYMDDASLDLKQDAIHAVSPTEKEFPKFDSDVVGFIGQPATFRLRFQGIHPGH